MTYQGESLLPGNIGYFFVTLSFTMAFLSLIAYFMYARDREGQYSWRNLGRLAFGIHGLATIGVMVTMFYLIYNHMFEYQYVWSHSSKTLPTKYMISCFWEGQEGSFLLWSFWHIVLGAVLIGVARKWEGSVMTFIMVAQVILGSMLLGISVGDVSIGSNPFVLLRNAKPDAPIFQNANYLNMISDGQGLNPLLQNYWMVIHPPTLFLGFASTIVPFAYAMAGLWQNSLKGWIKEALPWTHFSLLVLGAGVLMGGAWAYEALNFGGFWAWDPVENAALVPWLLIVAGLHSMVIFRSRGKALMSSFLFTTLGFILVLYATYLTRSGVLGDSSVHSFTGSGMGWQLLGFIGTFVLIAAVLIIRRWKLMPGSKEEDKLLSREFWMYIGSLVLTLSAFHVIFVTSFPVLSKIPGVDLAPPADKIEHYNKFQLPFAVIITIMTGFAQFMRYRDSNGWNFTKQLIGIVSASAALTAGFAWLVGMQNSIFITLLFASVFGVVGNAAFMGPLLKKGRFRFTASSVSHIGFALVIIGALVSISQQEVISLNRQGVDYGKNFDKKAEQQNKLLQKFEPKIMDNYLLTYVGDSTSKPNTYYKVRYHRLHSRTLDTLGTFTLKPRAQVNDNMGLIASPDTRHYLTRDIYTHVKSVPDKEREDFDPKYDSFRTFKVKRGEVFEYEDLRIEVLGINPDVPESEVPYSNYRIASTLKLRVSNDFVSRTVTPLMVLKRNKIYSPGEEVKNLEAKIRFTRIVPEDEAFKVAVSKGEQEVKDYIIMKAIMFPYINLLWLGSVVMTIGFGIAVYRRKLERKAAKKVKQA